MEGKRGGCIELWRMKGGGGAMTLKANRISIFLLKVYEYYVLSISIYVYIYIIYNMNITSFIGTLYFQPSVNMILYQKELSVFIFVFFSSKFNALIIGN